MKSILLHPVITRCPFKVHSQVTFQSRSTEHAHLMCGELTRQLTCHIENVFASNRSQTKSEKNDTEDE